MAEGFEEIEALTPVDFLRRAGMDVRTAAAAQSGTVVTGSHGIPVTADMTAEEVLGADAPYEAVILPGGMPGTRNLDADDTVTAILERARETEGCVIAAICAAPLILGRRGMLEEKRAVCFPGFEGELKGAEVLRAGSEEGRAVTDGRIVTACGMGAATEFSLALVKILKGEDAAETLRAAVLAK